MESLRLIGYWRNDQHLEFPDPHDFVDETWDVEERREVVDYLRSGFVPWSGMGYSPCRICGAPNGSVEFTDWTYVWPEGLSHYVAEHSVRLPRPIVEHIKAKLDAFESRDIVDDSWWLHVQPDGAEPRPVSDPR